MCLAAMASATSRVRLGTTVTPVPRRKPWELAAQTVALDHLSGGRLILGVGSGDGADPGFAAVGEAVDNRTPGGVARRGTDRPRRAVDGPPGAPCRGDVDRRLLDEFAAAGATWCGTWIPPGTLAEARAVIGAGTSP